MLLDRFFPPDIRVEKEARTLLREGHEVFLLSLGRGDMPDEELVDGIRVIRQRPQGLPERVWSYLQFKVCFIHSFWGKTLENAVRKYQVEALHIHDLPLVKTGLHIAHKLNLPIIADLHENYSEAIKAYRTSWQGRFTKPVRVRRWKGIEKRCVQQTDKIITVVDEAKECYVHDYQLPPEKVIVVMNTEDLDYFYSLPFSENIAEKYQPYFIISYIGGFGHPRGIQTAISAMPQLLSEIPQARLLLVGSGSNETELRWLANRLEVNESVEFTGWQPFHLVPSYIAASQVCLIPHIASRHTDTTIPHKIFQCMAMGKPVVVSSAKPLERIIKETSAGLVYPSGDEQALADAVIKIYRDNGLAIKLGEAGKRAVEGKYNWKREGEKLVTLYQDLEKGIR